jgi:hypothetical protein
VRTSRADNGAAFLFQVRFISGQIRVFPTLRRPAAGMANYVTLPQASPWLISWSFGNDICFFGRSLFDPVVSQTMAD